MLLDLMTRLPEQFSATAIVAAPVGVSTASWVEDPASLT